MVLIKGIPSHMHSSWSQLNFLATKKQNLDNHGERSKWRECGRHAGWRAFLHSAHQISSRRDRSQLAVGPPSGSFWCLSGDHRHASPTHLLELPLLANLTYRLCDCNCLGGIPHFARIRWHVTFHREKAQNLKLSYLLYTCILDEFL